MRTSQAGIAIAVLAFAGTSFAQQTPDWATRVFDAGPSQVYAAALKSIQVQKHEVQARNEQGLSVDFHVGTTAWSWGYNMRLVVTPVDGTHSKVTTGILKSGGKVFSWGSGNKEVGKIYAGIEAELASAKVNAPQSSPEPPKQDCMLEIKSNPLGADIELDGKFVGNTPTTLKLKQGEYEVTIRRAGFLPWTRKITAIPDNQLSIMAELEKAQ